LALYVHCVDSNASPTTGAAGEGAPDDLRVVLCFLRLFAALGPLGRLLGYEPAYSQGRSGMSHKVLEGVALGTLLSLLFTLFLLWRRKLLHAR
jgi:hypothetical protein